MEPLYLEAYRSGRLKRRAERALGWLKKCVLCPRLCRVNRLADERGTCRTGRYAVLASFGPHFGEEDPLVGRNGSGTIFFAHCNLLCLFCQNFDISHQGHGVPVGPEQLADVMVELQERGCHNINLVTPTHVLAQILEAMPLAVEKGLRVPLVYNCGGYERVAALRLLEGIVDIYMPDFKFWDPSVAQRLCDAADYPERARQALLEMHRQVGELRLDPSGIAQRGLLVRHLVMPEGMAGTEAICRFISRRISPNTYVNIMDQYRPCGRAREVPALTRPLTAREYEEAMESARRAGLHRLDRRRPRFMVWP
ncbi:putative pyruvate formate lyase activating enzyme [Desulfacinum hydrothermale DSM 13146]|uniref:Putative pyruvate formate lyase activating enzyme n=1 Tax=Desulfacinum hydrothermale DSM 13146 TaxID=1121390 RepID=A0A1W1XVW5_9BACT|nr:radical SAM protein [Desulfacinum hydrothermale]SMC27668.1 putative pyruvate formate lyase activating enzyme [Desulfacinum hydrothermale DSM 13146]